MSRTFRHSNKGNKNLNKYAVSRHFDYVYYKEQRKPNKIKGGAIIEDNEEFLVSVQNGHFQEGIPKAYRKAFNRQQKEKMKQKLLRQVREEKFEEIGGEKFIKNAGYFYY